MTTHELAQWLLAQKDVKVLVPADDNEELLDPIPRLYGTWEMTGQHNEEFVVIGRT